MCAHFVYADINEITGQIYTYHMVWFPVTSSQGSKYIMVLYKFYGNATMLAAYKDIQVLMVCLGLCLKLQRLDNKVSNALIEFMY